jgi:hypothetical protein
MNLYFLVEGRRTESIVYPRWLRLLLPDFERIQDPFSLTAKCHGNHYYLFDGGGYPNMLKDAVAAAMDLNEIGVFDYFIVCLDTDDESCSAREDIVRHRIAESGVSLKSTLVVITQKVCIESWFLGNRALFKSKHKDTEYLKYINFYDTSKYDPEYMDKPNYFKDSTAIFHFKYFDTVMRKNGLRYTKGKPYDVCEKEFLEELITRAYFTDHLNSFKKFIDLCRLIKGNAKQEAMLKV